MADSQVGSRKWGALLYSGCVSLDKKNKPGKPNLEIGQFASWFIKDSGVLLFYSGCFRILLVRFPGAHPEFRKVPRFREPTRESAICCLVARYRAILRYYRCDTPYRAILFQGGSHFPKMVRYPPLGT